MRAFRLALARAVFNAGLWKLGGLALPEGGVLLLDGGATLVFRDKGRVETRKGRRSRLIKRHSALRRANIEREARHARHGIRRGMGDLQPSDRRDELRLRPGRGARSPIS